MAKPPIVLPESARDMIAGTRKIVVAVPCPICDAPKTCGCHDEHGNELDGLHKARVDLYVRDGHGIVAHKK